MPRVALSALGVDRSALLLGHHCTGPARAWRLGQAAAHRGTRRVRNPLQQLAGRLVAGILRHEFPREGPLEDALPQPRGTQQAGFDLLLGGGDLRQAFFDFGDDLSLFGQRSNWNRELVKRCLCQFVSFG